jgi:hypothetical protein
MLDIAKETFVWLSKKKEKKKKTRRSIERIVKGAIHKLLISILLLKILHHEMSKDGFFLKALKHYI